MAQALVETVVHTFGTMDLIIFALSIAIGAFIGIYFAYFAPKGCNQEVDYLVGDRNMGIFPIAMSLGASALSGITMLGQPAETRVYGCQIMYSYFIILPVTFVCNKQILPVFHSLKGLSLNEYFTIRFDRRLRILASILYVVGTMSYLPIAIYVPALAYEQVTGYNVHLVTPIVCIVCIFYTSIGGIKAVVWTDAVQMISMLIAVAVVVVKGTLDVGISEIWQKNVENKRIEPPFIHLDPTVRHTIFGIVVASLFYQLNFGFINQAMVQRHQAMQTLDRAKKAVWWSVVLILTLLIASGYSGLIISAKYYDCDPVTVKLARTQDQVVPLFVMESVGRIPGLAGLFIAGIFSASLSSMSSALNTLSAIIIEDWIRGCNIWNPTERQASCTMKVFVVAVGILTVGLVFVVEKLGMVLQMWGSIASLSAGSSLTIFLAGLFLPWVTGTGALVGAIAAVISIAPIMLPTQIYISQGTLHFPAKPLSVQGCTQMYNLSQEFVNSVKVAEETLWPMGPTRGEVWYPFRISYLWYGPISLTCGLTAAILFTIFVSRTNLKHVDSRLIAPFSRRWLPHSREISSHRGNHFLVPDREEPGELLQL